MYNPHFKWKNTVNGGIIRRFYRNLIFFKCAQITTTDVEKSFSRYEKSLCDNRHSFSKTKNNRLLCSAII